jgi:gliding motility-associated protein GldC
MKKSKITIDIELDDNNIPEAISWNSTDAQDKTLQESKAILLSLFDRNTKETLKIDLWTKEMQVAEMDRFVFQTLKSLCDTYYKATQNAKMASAMQQFTTYFGEETEIIPK